MRFTKSGLTRRTAAMAIFLFLVLGKVAAAQSAREIAIKAYAQGHYDEAETLFLKAFHDAETNRDDYDTAVNLSGLGDVYQTEERFDEAQAAYRKSLSIFRRLPDSNLVVAIALHNMASAYTAARQYQEALAALKESFKLAEKVQQPHAELTGEILNSLGVAYFYQEKTGKAESLFQAAIQTYTAGGNVWEADLAQCFNNLAEVYRRRHRFQNAEAAYKRSIALTEEQLGPAHPDLAVILENLGDVYTDLKRYTEAEAQYQRSLAIVENGKPQIPVRMIHALHGLSRVYLEKGDKTQAEKVLARAAEFIGSSPGWNPEVPDVLETYAMLLKRAGKFQQAEDVHWRAARAIAAMTLTVRAQDLK
jgi:tetratricopeptide (TPR) repeat protein